MRFKIISAIKILPLYRVKLFLIYFEGPSNNITIIIRKKKIDDTEVGGILVITNFLIGELFINITTNLALNFQN